jgi:LysM repeat protein
MSPDPKTVSSPVPARSGTARLVVLVVLGVLAVAEGAYITVLRGRYTELQTESTKTIDAHAQTIALQVQQIQALDQLATRVDRFNKEFSASLGKIQVDENLEVNLKALQQKEQLPETARKTLEEFEKSVQDIQALAAKAKEFEKYLGSPVTVKGGDTHALLARTYLVKEAQLSPAQADEVLRHTALSWELEPGNRVFNLLHDGILLTTVTQGTARHSPLVLQWMQRRAAETKTQELEAKVQKLEATVHELEARLTPAPAAPPAPPAPPAPLQN